MNSPDRQQIITGVLDSPQFQLLLRQQIRKVLLGVRQEQLELRVQQSEEHCELASSLVLEISSNLESLIDHSVRHTLNQRYAELLDCNSRYHRDFEQLKEKVLKLSIRFPVEELSAIKVRNTRPACWSQDKLPQVDSFEESLQRDPFELNSRESPQLRKIRREMQGIRDVVNRLSNNSILQLVEENHSEMYKKIEDNYLRLSRAVQESIERLNDSQMERSVHSNNTEHLQKQVQMLTAAQKDMLQKQYQFESAMISKHQVSLRSVWNVITKIQSDMQQRTSAQSNRGWKSPVTLDNQPSKKNYKSMFGVWKR